MLARREGGLIGEQPYSEQRYRPIKDILQTARKESRGYDALSWHEGRAALAATVTAMGTGVSLHRRTALSLSRHTITNRPANVGAALETDGVLQAHSSSGGLHLASDEKLAAHS